MDIEWNQPIGTVGIEEREPVQIGVVASDVQFERTKIFSKTIRLKNSELLNANTVKVTHMSAANIMQGKEKSVVLKSFQQTFPIYNYIVVWTRDTYELFKRDMKECHISMRKHNKMQHPIYRGRIGGTIYFELEKYTPYETLQVYLKAENYTIRNVEPLSSRKEKRLAVFVMISEKYCAEKQLALITKEIVSYVRNLNVFSTAASETKFKNMSARAVWCYFGHDESDMVNHRYFARSIWACDRTGKKKYYSEQKNSSIIRGIWVTTDSFYESVRRLQQSELTREEFESRIQKTLCQTTSLAERYIADIREIDNQIKTISEIRKTYREWIQQVYEEYFKMTEIPTVPDDLHDRFNVVEDLAGCVLDMALLLNKDEEYTDGNQWLIKNNIRKYYEGLEKLKIIDEKGR